MSHEQSPDLTRDDDFMRRRETVYRYAFLLCAFLSILTTVGIIGSLLFDAVIFFEEVPVTDFLLGTDWSPAITPKTYGVLPLVYGTLLITAGSAAIAMPLGLLTAIYLSEYASKRTRSVLKPLLEILAGVPTVIYGLFALIYVTPALNVVVEGFNSLGLFRIPTLDTFNALSASIIVGIMIIPMVSSISEDAISSVPDSLRQGGYSLGATKFQVSTSIVVPAAASGIASSFILALSRAIGETMAVTVAGGMVAPDLPGGPFDVVTQYFSSSQTMTAAMVQLGQSDLAGGTTGFQALFAIGLLLFTLTLTMNVVGDFVSERYREEYE